MFLSLVYLAKLNAMLGSTPPVDRPLVFQQPPLKEQDS